MATPKTAKEFDERFDAGEDLESLGVDLSKVSRPDLESQRISLDLPLWLLRKIDDQAQLRGVTRQSLIKTWLFDRIEQSILKS